MKFLAIAALLGAISADQLLAENTETIQRVRVSENMKRVTCPRLSAKLNYAREKADETAQTTRVNPDTVGANDLHDAQQTLARECRYESNHFVCQPGSIDRIQDSLRKAQELQGLASKKNSYSKLELAFSNTEWAYIYSKRCLFSTTERYVPTALVDVNFGVAGHKKIDADVLAIKKTIHRQASNEKGQLADIPAAFHKVSETQAAKNLKNLETKFEGSPMGKIFKGAVNKAVMDTKAAVEKRPNGVHVDNAKIPALKKEWMGVKAGVKKIEGSKWGAAFEKRHDALEKTPEAANLMKEVKEYKNSKQGHILKAKVQQLKKDMKQNVKVTNPPKNM